jgi:hypothetical protein
MQQANLLEMTTERADVPATTVVWTVPATALPAG